MRRVLLFVFGSILGMILSWQVHSQTQAERSYPPPHERFQGIANLRTDAGPTPVGIRIQEWTLDGGTRLDALPLPARGLLIVQLRAGELTTVIQGNRERRQEGATWTVAPGVPMGVETGNDAAGFDVILIER